MSCRSLLLLLPLLLPAQAPPVFVELAGVPATRHETHSLAAGDLDGDGDVDLVLGNVGFSVIWRNDGAGRFRELVGEGRLVLHAESNAVALQDFDGDGDLDLFSASGGWLGAIHDLLRNDGSARFASTTYDDVPQDYSRTNGMAAGDLDGDGDVDLFLARLNRTTWFQNDGNGTFTNRLDLVPDQQGSAMAVALCDLDGDGDLDAVLGDAIYEPNRLWLNDGRGHFTDETATRLPSDQDATTALLAADFDGDGDVDLLAGNGRLGGEQPKLYHNDGKGHFEDVTAASLPRVRCETLALAAIDVDRDGDLDVVLGCADGADGAANALWLNDGSGKFTVAPEGALPERRERTTCLLPVDLDGDGVPELVVGNGAEGGARTRIWRLAARAR
ncbi:MAG: VCBS repeat-containing protein [Planctomycetes bacterium]|nr:VCBS repeat-containing protein [Planctomycetota bacterium]